LFAGAAYAAYATFPDAFGNPRVASFTVTCDNTPNSPCVVTVMRARSLTAQAQSEALAAGLTIDPIPETPLIRSATRAQINTFLAATSAP
jgi:hypothetical protein